MPPDLRESVERFAHQVVGRYPLDTLEDPGRQRSALAFTEQGIPGLRDFVGTLTGCVADAAAVVVTGAYTGCDEVIAILSSALGIVSSGGNGYPPRLVFDVTPRVTADGAVLTGSRGYDEFAIHTDSATHAVPHAFFTLACVTAPADAGGESLLVRADDVAAELAARGAASALSLLADPIYPYLADFGDDGTKIRLGSVLADGTVRYGGKEIRAGSREHPVDADHFSALEQFESVIEGLTHTYLLRPDDILFVDNRRVLHGRRAFEPTARRLLKRCKIHRAADSRIERTPSIDPGGQPTEESTRC